MNALAKCRPQMPQISENKKVMTGIKYLSETRNLSVINHCKISNK